jgi:hypothetical protein
MSDGVGPYRLVRGVRDQPVTDHDARFPRVCVTFGAYSVHILRLFGAAGRDRSRSPRPTAGGGVGPLSAEPSGVFGWSRSTPTSTGNLVLALGHDGPRRARWVRTWPWLKDHLRGDNLRINNGRRDDQDDAARRGLAVARLQCGRRRPAPVRGPHRRRCTTWAWASLTSPTSACRATT